MGVLFRGMLQTVNSIPPLMGVYGDRKCRFRILRSETPSQLQSLPRWPTVAVYSFMRAFFAEADAAVIACPEYNRGMPGVLKNALDWLSRPPDLPLHGKCALLISTATGGIGGALAHYQARQVLAAMGVIVVPGREVVLPFAADRFTQELRLRQESDRIFLREAMERFCALSYIVRKIYS